MSLQTEIDTTETVPAIENFPFARKAAAIAEIRDTICTLINTCDKRSSDTLARLLRTNRDFFYSAARALWGGRDILSDDLLALLAGFGGPSLRADFFATTATEASERFT
ncbi:hypothetical protein FRC07_004969 [Ceratobasidium sp. 392]|nr:hypothetical protein FRC07_004969 [Ceratobasidium sp. 392]